MRTLLVAIVISLCACAHAPAAAPSGDAELAAAPQAQAVPASALPDRSSQSPSWRDCRDGEDLGAGCDRGGPGAPVLNLAPVAMPAH
jgi:hypothetical protein